MEGKERNHPRLIKTRLSQESSSGREAAQLIGTDSSAASHDKSSPKSQLTPIWSINWFFLLSCVIRSASTLTPFLTLLFNCFFFFFHPNTNNVFEQCIYSCVSNYVTWNRNKCLRIRSQIFTINSIKGLFTHLDNIPSKTSVISNPRASLNIGTMLEKHRANIISRLSSANGSFQRDTSHFPLSIFSQQLEKLLFHNGNRDGIRFQHVPSYHVVY